MAENTRIRAATDADAGGLISLISNIFSEYPGCVIDLETLDRDLLAIRTYVRERGGDFWVAEAGGEIQACAGYTRPSEGMVELKRLYVAKAARQQGLGNALFERVVAAAKRCGAKAIECWSDTRFKDAHAFYLKRGFVQSPETRALNDPSNTIEFHFRKTL